MKNTASSSVLKTIQYIEQHIDQGTWQTGTKIPAGRKLALDIGVGPVSVNQAIRILVSRKKLTSKEKVGVFVGPSLPPGSALLQSRCRQPKKEVVKEGLKRELLQGKYYNQDFLPSLKELQNEFETSYQIMRNVVEDLVSEKILTYSKRIYRIVKYTTSTSHNIVLLVMSKQAMSGASYSIAKVSIDEFVQSLEKECAIKKIRLIKHQADLPFPATVPLNQVMGYIIWFDIFVNAVVPELMQRITHKKPITFINRIYDIGKNWAVQWIEETKRNPTWFVSDVTREVEAGQVIAQFLLSKGHKKVGYIAHVKSEQVIDQYNGIVEKFNDAGLSNCVYLSCVDDVSDSSDVKTLKFAKDIGAHTDFFRQTQDTLTKVLSPSVASWLSISLHEAKFAADYQTVYHTAFTALSERTDITAWICQDDAAACYGALEFLKTRSIRTPQQIGVMGCSDMSNSSFHGLSSYHYDYAGAARKMLNLVLFPEYAKKTLCIKGTNIFKVDGMMIDRGSV